MDIGTIVLGVIFGMALSVVLFFIWENRKTTQAETKSEKIVSKAETKRERMISDAREESQNLVKKAKEEAIEITSKAREGEDRIAKTELRVIEREEKIEQRLEQISKRQDDIIVQEEKLKENRDALRDKEAELDGKLSEISKLSEEEAKEIYLTQIGDKYSLDAKNLIDKHKKKIELEKTEMAREIILKSIQQYAGNVTSEVTTTVIQIPSDDIKGKLIGKEGRNITTFEKNAGVSLIIDDTPDTVFISAFDLYRRYIAKKSLEKLIEDGRIQPARIEEVIKATESEGENLLRELGNQVLEELNIRNIPEEIVPIIGKLRFRTSYGQNMLKHSKEVAIIADAIGRELGVDQKLLRMGGLLHDLGKALDHDIEGTHPEIGAKIGRKYGLPEEVIDMIENHHGEQFSISIYAAIIQVADAISSVRPGARREAIEQYLKRVQEMEALVQSFSGVDKAYALSAGREVRVFVNAVTISDMQAQKMAQDIAHTIEEKLQYPGEVKVSLIRETRCIEYAK
ncbi:ribonuclease Y [Candidatus Gracilibacteria bacterium]|nr:ribonuclease Y [Candidatus Gracilibacteria bacterium]